MEGPGATFNLIEFSERLVVRVTGRESAISLHSEIVIGTGFVRGKAPTSIGVDDLESWQSALDSLDAGRDVSWRKW
ncbi:DUF5959 family protein [Antribacter gilvus]|uniref:DUF5959 family protein n=1 Tax=Antribacter gilvus TaxID=2304675 RepID=UPI003B82FCA0